MKDLSIRKIGWKPRLKKDRIGRFAIGTLLIAQFAWISAAAAVHARGVSTNARERSAL